MDANWCNHNKRFVFRNFLYSFDMFHTVCKTFAFDNRFYSSVSSNYDRENRILEEENKNQILSRYSKDHNMDIEDLKCNNQNCYNNPFILLSRLSYSYCTTFHLAEKIGSFYNDNELYYMYFKELSAHQVEEILIKILEGRYKLSPFILTPISQINNVDPSMYTLLNPDYSKNKQVVNTRVEDNLVLLALSSV